MCKCTINTINELSCGQLGQTSILTKPQCSMKPESWRTPATERWSSADVRITHGCSVALHLHFVCTLSAFFAPLSARTHYLRSSSVRASVRAKCNHAATRPCLGVRLAFFPTTARISLPSSMSDRTAVASSDLERPSASLNSTSSFGRYCGLR